MGCFMVPISSTQFSPLGTARFPLFTTSFPSPQHVVSELACATQASGFGFCELLPFPAFCAVFIFYATLSHPHYHGFVIEVCGHVWMSHAENNLGTMEPYMARTANPPTQGSNSFGKRAVVPSRLLIVRFVSTEERICKSNFKMKLCA